jgi:hypothetical protein
MPSHGEQFQYGHLLTELGISRKPIGELEILLIGENVEPFLQIFLSQR